MLLFCYNLAMGTNHKQSRLITIGHMYLLFSTANHRSIICYGSASQQEFGKQVFKEESSSALAANEAHREEEEVMVKPRSAYELITMVVVSHLSGSRRLLISSSSIRCERS